MNKEQAIRSGIPCFSMEEPPLYDVIMHNDDVTTMEFVVDVLMDVFRKDCGNPYDEDTRGRICRGRNIYYRHCNDKGKNSRDKGP